MSHWTRGLATTAITLGLLAAPAAAQVVDQSDNTAYGSTSGEFLLLGAGARGMALGNAFDALANDVTALYHNPAGLALMERPAAMVSTYSYVSDTRYSWVGIGLPMGGGARAIGLSLGSFGFSDQPVYTPENPEGDGTVYSVTQTFLTATYSQNFSDRFSAGFNFKVIEDKLGAVKATGFSLDLGTNFHAMLGERPIRAAFVIHNLGSTLRHTGQALDVAVVREPPLGTVDVPQEPAAAQLQTKDFGLPVIFRVSAALDLLSTTYNSITLLGEFSQPNNTKPGAGMGLEWAMSNLGNSGFALAARGSYTIQPDNSETEFDLSGAGFESGQSNGSFTGDGLAVGGGLGYVRGNLRLGVDYAWKNLGALGGTNVFSLTVGW
jgi:hypothetical protein